MSVEQMNERLVAGMFIGQNCAAVCMERHFTESKHSIVTTQTSHMRVVLQMQFLIKLLESWRMAFAIRDFIFAFNKI